jgi:hypothetical protein
MSAMASLKGKGMYRDSDSIYSQPSQDSRDPTARLGQRSDGIIVSTECGGRGDRGRSCRPEDGGPPASVDLVPQVPPCQPSFQVLGLLRVPGVHGILLDVAVVRAQ